MIVKSLLNFFVIKEFIFNCMLYFKIFVKFFLVKRKFVLFLKNLSCSILLLLCLFFIF